MATAVTPQSSGMRTGSINRMKRKLRFLHLGWKEYGWYEEE